MEDYIKEEVIINIGWANVFGIIVGIVAFVIFGIPYFSLWREQIADIPSFRLFSLKFSIAFVLGIVAHELIHGLFWAAFTKDKFKSIKFGVMGASKLFSPYCHCKEPLKLHHYRIGGIMPLIILGIIPAIISIFIGSLFWFGFGIFFTMAASGDILVLKKTLKEKNDSLIFDLPDEAGYHIYRLKSKE